MKRILSYTLLVGIASLGGLAYRDRPKDQTDAWNAYYKRIADENAFYKTAEAERNKKPEYASIMLDPEQKWTAETHYKYRLIPPGKGLSPEAAREFEEKWDKIYQTADLDSEPQPRRESEYSYQREQPDLSGLYYQRTIVGPNAGQWSIQFISGP